MPENMREQVYHQAMEQALQESGGVVYVPDENGNIFEFLGCSVTNVKISEPEGDGIFIEEVPVTFEPAVKEPYPHA